ncbi:MAG: glycoside hydrolase N-terminal domain-containing protein [Ferruginibacter sp.]|nr:glycoside hydrolase N-terminal domain-containing protein [Ferruginibacter sp.]
MRQVTQHTFYIPSRLFLKTIFVVFLAFGNQQIFAQELKLWYKQPAVKWTEALPLGNGRIGAMVFGGAVEERIQFNEETLWTGGPRNYNKKGAYKYLDSIRQLLFEGNQKAAEALAEKEFMGLKSADGDREKWVKDMFALKGINGDPAAEKFSDAGWKTMPMPAYDGWEPNGFDGLDGAVWLRTSFELPAAWQEQDLVLDLNRIRDYDRTFINGKLAGSQQNQEARKYIVKKELLHPGKNIIAVQVINFSDRGGIGGYKDTSRHIGIYPLGKETEKLSLNGDWKYFIQNDEPPVTGVYEASYQPFGDLHLRFNHQQITDYKRELDLANAIAATTYKADGVSYRREYLVSAPHQALVMQLTASSKGKINFEASLSSPHKKYVITRINNNTISLHLKVANGALRGVSYLQVKTSAGSVALQAGKLVISNADTATLYLVAGTNFKNYKDVSGYPAAKCISALKGLNGQAYTRIKNAHIKEYVQHFNTLKVNLGKEDRSDLPTDERIDAFAGSPDPAFMALYLQYGRYLLISSSRPGTGAANLQGIWNDLLMPPWGSKYTTNINAQMNYWPAELLNLSNLHQPLFEMIKELAQTGKETAREYYNAPGWVLHHNTDIWRGTAPINAANHGIWVTGAAWLCQHLWEHYAFTQNKKFLKDTAYPLMKEAARFFDKNLVQDPKTGTLISSPSNSPEQGGLVAGPTMDHQIIRQLFKVTIEAGRLLEVDKNFRDSLQDKHDRIAPNKIGRYGQLQEWMEDVDDTANKHRHVSHLWAQYPGNEINFDETPELMKAARQSLLYRGDAATGWSLGWKINLWARFKDGDHALNLVKMLISPAAKFGAGSYPNLFDAHPPFQIDGNFGGAAGIGEMLVQSHTKYIDLLPALPAILNTGNIRGICARGGFVLDLDWQDGKLVECIVNSLAGQDCQLRYNGKTIILKTGKGKKYKLNGSLTEVK